MSDTPTAEQIVRALAAADPRDRDGECPLCFANAGWWHRSRDQPDLAQAYNHKSDCPWRLAAEWAPLWPATGDTATIRTMADAPRP